MYHETTNDIMVSVMPVYIDEKSTPEKDIYFWAYRVTIKNKSKNNVQLISRYWRISDALGRIEEVEGEGVIGEQPILEPDAHFEYTSGCPLTTTSGIMVGTYTMINIDKENKPGAPFKINIPAFSLDIPDADHIIN